jgi:hypothetical protein
MPGVPRIPPPAGFTSGRGTGSITNMTPADIVELQRMLSNLGFYSGPQNGVADLNTLGAAGAYLTGFGFGDANEIGYAFDEAAWYGLMATNYYVDPTSPGKGLAAPPEIVQVMTDNRAHWGNNAIVIPTSQAQVDLGTAPAPAPVDTTVPATPPVDTTTTNPVDTGEVARKSAKAIIDENLRQWGLEGLSGQVDEWLKDPVFVNNPAAVATEIRKTETYRTRFAGMAQRTAGGLNAISESEYLELERGYQSTLRQFGLPASFYDQPDDFAGFIGRDLSVAEIADRALKGYVRVQEAAPEVRAAFTQMFGVQGDANLAAWFLDPDKAAPLLERQVEMAAVSGSGAQQGFNIDQSIADTLVRRGIREEQAQQGFFELGRSRRLFDESISESQDLIAEREGVGAVFGTDAEAARLVDRRLQGRKAAFEGGGGALVTERGISGLGTSR